MRFEFKDGQFEFATGQCVLFGILNVTPDSFSDGGQFFSPESALARALELERDGAAGVDVGGESTRPGAAAVSVAEEMGRVLPVIRLLRRRLRIAISIDTTKAAVADAALAEGAAIVNDISGLTADARMAEVIASSKAGLILMHSRGTPAMMQTLCNYRDVVKEVKDELLQRRETALAAGISPRRIALDPGIGFAKTREQNLTLLRHLEEFTFAFTGQPPLEHPLMVGVSRKSFLGGEIGTRGPGTLAAEMWACLQGAQMIRTHDISATRRALATAMAIRHSGDSGGGPV
ncbi:MAG: dihydropteroate synthase [Verrucomicrobia bacterium]|nr:dihydropteroate synthase [Verrucomicrobiota bacterium]